MKIRLCNASDAYNFYVGEPVHGSSILRLNMPWWRRLWRWLLRRPTTVTAPQRYRVSRVDAQRGEVFLELIK